MASQAESFEAGAAMNFIDADNIGIHSSNDSQRKHLTHETAKPLEVPGALAARTTPLAANNLADEEIQIAEVKLNEMKIALMKQQQAAASAEKERLNKIQLEPFRLFQTQQEENAKNTQECISSADTRISVISDVSSLMGTFMMFKTEDAGDAAVITMSYAVPYVFISIAIVDVLNYLYFITRFLVAHRQGREWTKSLNTTSISHRKLTTIVSGCTILLSDVICRYSFMIYTIAICVRSHTANKFKVTCENF